MKHISSKCRIKKKNKRRAYTINENNAITIIIIEILEHLNDKYDRL